MCHLQSIGRTASGVPGGYAKRIGTHSQFLGVLAGSVPMLHRRYVRGDSHDHKTTLRQ